MARSFFTIFFTFTILNIFCHVSSNKPSPTFNTTDSETKSVTSFYSTSHSESKSETPRYYSTEAASKSSSLSHYNTRDSQPKSSPTSYRATDFERKSTWLYNSTDNTKESDVISSISSYFTSSEPSSNNSTNEKDPSLAVCPRVILEPGDYIIFSNGTLHVESLSLTLNSSDYIQDGGSVVICEIGFVDEKTELYWNAAHYLLSAFVIQAFTIALSPTYIRIISNKNFGLTLVCLFLSNISFQMVRNLNLQTLQLWILLPYVLNFVTVILAAWITLVAFDFTVLVIKIFGLRVYSNQAMIERANHAICLLLLILAFVTMVTTFFDVTSIYLSYPGYLHKAKALLDKSLPTFSLVLIMTFSNVIGCIFREIAFEKYADDFILDLSKWNVAFLRNYFAVVSVWIFIACAMIYKSWLVFFISLTLSCIAVEFGYKDRDFTEERLSFFNYIPIAGVSRPFKEDVDV